MKITGLGTDIVEVERIAEFAKNSAALERVFSKTELEYCLNKKNKYEHLAVRFAAKEAVYKALPFGGVALKDIEVSNLSDGSPQVTVNDKRAETFKINISLSHTKNYATAVALVTEYEDNK
ncbi:Holo-acyl-carrier-protein synthase [Elusimicrobium minutum Pei191]|uniref:Holo-[acyl-carrier-protein] synthase n=1 Tax=Elusimicrobium minutum (strain Pei191) TaxID=445932 RepID=B2KEC2_ELUMP|nr:holo-ACP synthase [Elusimicrobium minutum]ACC98868.1 Holo-acyl-carrier-protein synthase [Elusimicrobium minutum Pei191]